MDREGKVVTLVTPQLLVNEVTGEHAARILELGLTAYGNTQDEAVRKVRRMYGSAVRAHRELGTLAEWLTQSSLTWYWADQYTGTVPVEDADPVCEAVKRGLVPTEEVQG